MKTILVPLDFSDVSAAVVHEAAGLAKALPAKLVLLHAVAMNPYPPEFLAEGGFAALPISQEECAKQLGLASDRLSAYAATHGIGGDADLEVRAGHPIDVILEEAKSRNADMIVIGSHGHGALYHLLLGGVASQILHDAACPVLVVRSQPAVAARMTA